MILVELRILRDPVRVFGVVRAAVETDRWSAFRIRAAGEIARIEHGRDAGDVGLEGERQQVELQLDVLVERLGNAVRSRPSSGTAVDAFFAISSRRSISRTSSM